MTLRLRHEFVAYIPTHLEDGVLYVSIPFSTAVHQCACGCGSEVVTPLSPTDWRLIFDGKTVSLHPSIGNWNFPCRSHYWVTRDTVQWAPKMSRPVIEAARRQDRRAKERYFEEGAAAQVEEHEQHGDIGRQARESYWRRLRRRLFPAR